MEERRHHNLVVHQNAGRRTADGVDLGQVGGRQLEAVIDAVVVVLGIRLRLGIPRDFCAEEHLPVLHGGHLVVAGAQVEADPAAVEVPAGNSGRFLADGTSSTPTTTTSNGRSNARLMISCSN